MIDTERFLRFLNDLIQIPSHSTSTRIAEFVYQRATKAGASAVLAEGFSDSVVVEVGPQSGPPLLIYSHLDTGSPTGWAAPLVPRRKEGRVYGLGASDDKASAALALELICTLVGRTLTRPIIFLFSGKEEGVSLEENPVQRMLVEGVIKPAEAVVLEPTCFEGNKLHAERIGVCVGCFGLFRVDVEFEGVQSHSGIAGIDGSAINALYPACRFADDFRLVFRKDQPRATWQPGDDESDIKSFGNVTQILAQEGPGTIPGRCKVSLDFRLAPYSGLSEKSHLKECHEIKGQLEKIAQKAVADCGGRGFKLSSTSSYAGYLQKQAPFTQELLQLSRSRGSMDAFVTVAPGRCDANVLEAAKVPAVVVGPGLMAQCHRRDEYIDEAIAVEASSLISLAICKHLF